MNLDNNLIVSDFIEEIWNENRFDKIGQYISPDFIDHSLPPNLPSNAEGMKIWIVETGKSFKHKTIIEDMVCQEDKVMLKIKMKLRHIGIWRSVAPTYAELSTTGFRYYKLYMGKIIEHWSLIDGNSIENQLNQTSHGCDVKD